MIRALRAGQAVGLLPDQVPPEGQGLWAPFFGQPAYTMTLAARLLQQTGATPLWPGASACRARAATASTCSPFPSP
jgi:KDO2-lipid IV(A) lauroyltransferase